MHPAFSVIFFTVSSGTGYGLLALMGIAGPAGWLPRDPWLGGVGLFIGLALVTSGLMSSTFHLGRPERAWRAFSQWRSSWLSREGVLAVVTYGPILVLAYLWVLRSDMNGLFMLTGVATAVMAMVTVYSTSMIYRSLKTIPEWSNQWTVANYLVLALVGGSVWLNALAFAFGAGGDPLPKIALIALLAGWAVKRAYWKHIDTMPAVTTPETATGLGAFGDVTKFEAPHGQANYLMKEMGFEIARKHGEKLRLHAQTLAFVLPILLTSASIAFDGAVAAAGALGAAVSVALGLLIERWLLFAQARHVVMTFYGRH